MATLAISRAEFQSRLAQIANHHDGLYLDDNLPSAEARTLIVAAQSVEAVRDALCTDKPVHPDVMARLLDAAAVQIRQADQYVCDAVAALGELQADYA